MDIIYEQGIVLGTEDAQIRSMFSVSHPSVRSVIGGRSLNTELKDVISSVIELHKKHEGTIEVCGSAS